MADEKSYSIPGEEPSSKDGLASSIRSAYAEFKGVATGTLDDQTARIRLILEVIFKVLLFGFLLIISFWWSYQVIQILWQAGRVGTNFHLSDPVLIALLTTSIANFLALITILAKSLFPANEKESILDKVGKLFRPSQKSND